MKQILVVDDQPNICRRLFQTLLLRGYNTVWSDTIVNAERMIDELEPALVLLNLCQVNGNAWELFNNLQSRWPGLRILTYAPGDMDADNSLSKAVDEVIGYLLCGAEQKTFGNRLIANSREAHCGR